MMRPKRLAVIHASCFVADPAPWSADFFARLLAEPSVFLCEAPDAFLLGRIVMDEAELLTIAVAPYARRKGHARNLLAQFDARMSACEARHAFLEVAETNLPARNLYARTGWVQIARRPQYYGPVAALVLEKQYS